MRIYKAKDYVDMSRKAANIVSAQVIMKPNCVLGLATGSTPIGLYKQLVEWYNKGDLDFSEVMTVNLDEYKGLSRDNDQSYYYFMHQNLFDHVNIPAENTHLPNGMEPDSQKECQEYTDLIQSLGGVDLQLLGIGHNGHIGFNEPGEAFDKQVHCVNLTQSTIEANKRFFASADDVPKQAYTMGIKTIMQAKKILIVASGEDKAEIVRDAFFGPITPKVPASVLQLHNDVTLVADEAALSDDLEAEKNVELASDDFTAIAAKILEGCGGKENIASIDNCVTRLRLEVKDMTAVNDKVIKSAGVAGVIRPGKTSVQVIVGTKVQFVADAFSKLCE